MTTPANTPGANPDPGPLGPSGREVGGTVRRNVSVTVAARIGYMITRIIIPPFVLARIGLEVYGIWTTLFILVSYMGVSTMGISGVYIKYIAEFNARREYDRINSLLSTGLAITLPLCSLLFAAFWLGWPYFSPFLHLPPAHQADAREAMLIVVGIFLLSISLNAFGDTLTGLQEIAITQRFWTISFLVEFAAIFVLVGMGRGIRGLAEAFLLRTIVNDGLAISWIWRRVPWLRISPRLCTRESVGYIVHFGGIVQLQSILSNLLSSIEKVVALFTIGLAATGLFDIAKKWPMSLQTLPMAFFGAYMPAASHLDAHATEHDRQSSLRDFYLRGSRYANFCTAWFCALMFAIPGAILRVWLGPKEPDPALLATLFVLYLVWTQWHMLTGPGNSILRGMGRVADEFFYSIPNAILLLLFIPASRLLLGRWAPIGIGVAAACATIGASCILLARVQHVLGFSLVRFLREVILPSLVFYVVAFALKIPIDTAIAHVGRWSGMFVLLVSGLFYTALSLLVLDRLVLDADERRMARNLILRLRAAIRRGSGATASDAEVPA
ncbi:MAG: lipopolysaccharide biosynthesis protein [Acidobacteriota bacterium]